METKMLFALYHGSNCRVENPKIIKGKFTKDFGPAFYCTRSLSQARSFSVRKSKRMGNPTVNLYICGSLEGLNVKEFSSNSEEWLSLIVDCRNGKPHEYDIVIGPVADDDTYRRVQEYNDGIITKKGLMNYLSYKNKSDQIAFCSDEALDRLYFKGVV